MIAVDTNVLVRFLVRDDEAQFARAADLLARAQRVDESVFVSTIVLCELVWVLRRAYKVGKADVVRVLNELVRARHVQLESPVVVDRALAAFARGPGDLADYLIREQAFVAGCTGVATFDGAVAGEDGFVTV